MRFLVFALALAFTVPAFADLASGTPHFSCSPPTQAVETIGSNTVLIPIPATGTQAIKQFNFYLDVPAASIVSAPGGSKIGPGVVPNKISLGNTASACDWQTALGDIASGSHNIRASVTTNDGVEGLISNPLAFTVPSAIYNQPLAPSGLTVQ